MLNDKSEVKDEKDWIMMDTVIATIIEDRIARKALEVMNKVTEDIKNIIFNVEPFSHIIKSKNDKIQSLYNTCEKLKRMNKRQIQLINKLNWKIEELKIGRKPFWNAIKRVINFIIKVRNLLMPKRIMKEIKLFYDGEPL